MAEARAQNQARLRPYVVTREYILFGKDKQRRRTNITAEISFQPPGFKQYEIVQMEGSGIGERIVRKMLDGETQIVKDYSATDISQDNYDFRLLGEDETLGIRCYRLHLTPKRDEKTLLRGTIWVDADSYLLRRMEAAPARTPSWWLRDVELIFSYQDVEGMWLQTASEFTTNVRLFGRHTMTSRDVRYVFGDSDQTLFKRLDSPLLPVTELGLAYGASPPSDHGLVEDRTTLGDALRKETTMGEKSKKDKAKKDKQKKKLTSDQRERKERESAAAEPKKG
jgi:hypothetical protein